MPGELWILGIVNNLGFARRKPYKTVVLENPYMQESLLDMVTVPEGEFLMGACLEDNEAETTEAPLRKIWLSTFAIQKTPVTVNLWQEFLNKTGYDWCFHDEVAQRSPTKQHPITCVSWHDCCAFARWLQDFFGEKYALPTEAQWEKACRGTEGQLYPWGSEEPEEYDILPPPPETTLPVGTRQDRQSPYGCLDMWQNVSEWCLDWYDEELYNHEDGEYYQTDPNVTKNPAGPATGRCKVFRGGQMMWQQGWPRCSYRTYQYPDYRALSLGFRVALSIN
ncbi:formylglycine-generating enzyme family protein [Kamptonema animale]|uniref:formylglycine-generating enzyme family protein n=1 Tax=Kamptonema animale TaxID=92934 RepID=UPI00232C77D1|nr:formylglycine-generating enzyme family protein [Kamptonema animale]